MKLKIKQNDYLKLKPILTLVLVVIFLLVGLFGILNLTSSFFWYSKNLTNLESENKLLRAKLNELTKKYSELDKDLNKLIKENNYLRIAANLPPLTEDEILLGTGGKEYDLNFGSNQISLVDLDKLTDFVESLSIKLKFEKTDHEKIAEKLKSNQLLYSSIPALKPCEGIVGMKGFGMREHPILGISKMHEGIDIVTDVGTKVYCPGNGVVTFVGVKNGYGLCIEIEHYGGYKTVYAHLSGTYVTEGQKVLRGKVIGLTGNSGLSTGPHLHYEVHHNGVKLDPLQFFFDDLVLFEQKNKK